MTLTVCNRPHYLRRALQALREVDGVGDWHLFIGLEPGNEECTRICEEIDFVPRTILRNPENLGVRGNPYNVLKHAFARGSEVNIYLEDDIVVSPDVCRLALWYRQLVPEDRLEDVRVMFLNLFVTSLGNEAADELTVDDILSPWGMIINRYQWEHIIEPAWWNDEHSFPTEQDWTMSLAEYLSRESRMFVLSPLLSRSTNIGREGGVHSSPERHDLLMKGLAMNQSNRYFNYKINLDAYAPRRRIQYDTMTVIDDFYSAAQGEKYPENEQKVTGDRLGLP
jgi:hypothetical protein